MRFKIVLYIFLLLILPVRIFADLRITVESNRGWGDDPTSNIKALCENVALHFQEQLRDEHKDEYKIGLKVTDTYWAQFSYQFGHEFCHILMRHDITHRNNPNGWFYESLCELANLWVIRRMGETWAHRAPYDNWAGWRHNLTDYANNWMLSRPEVQYSGTGAEWLRRWEDTMRDNLTTSDYATLAQLSYTFLHIFEDTPEAWNAVRQIPGSRKKMSEFMKDWHKNVDSQDKRFVEAIAKEMGISITADTVVSIDADINNDGYVDLSDVLIVRSAIQNSVSYNTDVNSDGKTDEIDVLIVKAKALEAIANPNPSSLEANGEKPPRPSPFLYLKLRRKSDVLSL